MQCLRATEDASVNRSEPAVTLGCTLAWGRSCTIMRAPQHPRETPGKNSKNTGRQDEYNELAKDTEGGGSPDTRSIEEAKRKHEKMEW